jgi:NitT/TauT family transport system substrate-binding protein
MTTMDRRQMLSLMGAGASLALPLPAFAQGAPEKPKVTLGVGGKSLLYYLPLTIAERKGFFKERPRHGDQRLRRRRQARCSRWSAARSTWSPGAYEHTLRMQAKGQDIRSVIELGASPAIVVAVRKARPTR